MRQGRKCGKAGDSLEEPAETVVGKAKYGKPSRKRKIFKQRKRSRKGRLSTSSSLESEDTERKRRKKKRSGQKNQKKVTFLIIKCFKLVLQNRFGIRGGIRSMN